jgi:23S rRNA (cytosine1962-C5)-methyltransferase
LNFRAPADFRADARLALREAVIDPAETNAYRLIHGASDKWPGWYVDRLGGFLLSQAEGALGNEQRDALAGLVARTGTRGAYYKGLTRQVRQTSASEASSKFVLGETAPGKFTVKENGVSYELSFEEGYSVGLFLDQRDNRRRFLAGHVAAGFPLFDIELEGREVLNTFAYTCSFSICAALAGARVTSLDLSKKYLEWGKRNFVLNDLDPAGHDFIYGDAFDWLRRMAKKQRRFSVVILDPPTFSQSRDSGVFRAEKDYGSLVQLALAVLKTDGTLLASANAAKWPAEEFIDCIKAAVAKSKRKVLQMHYAPQPPDFPVTKREPAYLKTLWLRVS